MSSWLKLKTKLSRQSGVEIQLITAVRELVGHSLVDVSKHWVDVPVWQVSTVHSSYIRLVGVLAINFGVMKLSIYRNDNKFMMKNLGIRHACTVAKFSLLL